MDRHNLWVFSEYYLLDYGKETPSLCPACMLDRLQVSSILSDVSSAGRLVRFFVLTEEKRSR